MASVFKRKYKDSRTGKMKTTSRWQVAFKDHNRIRRTLPGFTDKTLTKDLGRKLERLAERRRLNRDPDEELAAWLETSDAKLKAKLAEWGMLDSRSVAGAKPLAEHIGDYRKHLEAKNNTPDHINPTISRIEAIANGCGFLFISDVSGSHVAAWLKDQREADAFGISTSNAYLTALKGFCNWLVKDRRANENPVSYLARLNAETDIRRQRRSLSQEDFGLLIEATRTGAEVCGLTSRERQMLYHVAAYTGLRASELASLTERSFDLEAEHPTVTVAAGYSKHRRKDTLPLNADLVVSLWEWFAERRQEVAEVSDIIPIGKPSADKLWPGKWAKNRHAAEMLRHDLKAARTAWIEAKGITEEERRLREESDRLKYLDFDERQFDFHALRGQFVTELGRAGVNLQDAQKLARHSDPRLTANHYTHLSVSDLSRSVCKLPALPKPKEAAQATGTDGKPATAPENCSAYARRPGAEQCRPVPESGNSGNLEDSAPEKQKPPKPSKTGASVEYPRGDSNPHEVYPHWSPHPARISDSSGEWGGTRMICSCDDQ